MTEKIEGKNGNQWQFISDENDIEIINNKLNWIARILFLNTENIPELDIQKYMEIFKNESKK